MRVEKSKVIKKENIYLFIILLLAASLRFWKLGSVPFGFTHDEMGYVYNAYSIAKTGRNVFGEYLPIFTWMNGTGFPFMPTTMYLLASVYGIFGISQFVARLPHAFLGVVDVLLLYFLVKLLFKNPKLAFLSALFLAISPWHIFFTRSAYDITIAYFLYLLSITLFIWEINKKKLHIFSLISLFLAIFAYRGMSAVFPFILALMFLYGFKKISRIQKLSFVLGAMLIIGIFSITVKMNASRGYLAEAFVDPTVLKQEIDIQSKEAVGPLKIKHLYLNKATLSVTKWMENYLESISPGLLFIHGEGSQIYSIWVRGRLYLLDLLFFIPGCVYLYKKDKRSGLFVFGIGLISNIPGALGGQPFASRNFLFSLIPPILVAGGLLNIYDYLKQDFLKKIFIAGMIIAYVYSLGGFLFDYYGRYAYLRSESWAKSIKDIQSIVAKNEGKYHRIVIANTTFGDLVLFSFYGQNKPSDVQKSFKNPERAIQKNALRIGNVIFVDSCFKEKDGKIPEFAQFKSVLYFAKDECNKKLIPKTYIRNYQGDTMWKLYEINQSEKMQVN